MFDKLFDLIIASMKETAENRLRMLANESLDNTAYLNLVSAILKANSAIIVEK